MVYKAKRANIAKPFVKWAGGKGNILSQLESLLPSDLYKKDITYIEPFVGGGAMFFYLLQKFKNISKAVINDINPDLIHCYKLIKDNPKELIERLKDLSCNYNSNDVQEKRDLYYACRDKYNQEGINVDERAALFLFLNHTCFNGLYRVNRAGKYNVPYGRYKRPLLCDENTIWNDHRILNSIDVVIREPGDYKLVLRHLSKKNKNFVYLDPPYRPLYNTSNFNSYFCNPFGDEQQEELKNFCDKLGDAGCMIMLSNSDSKDSRGNSYFEELYKGYSFHRIVAPRYINANPQKRTKLEEIVITNYGKK